ncbi:MAG: trimeric intracellular cation channel family protein [Rhodospirillaceae bacterium]|jgi:uncharacterized membrane protein YeiH|nr:trimeric intracellular cation channel family protein [Rhodospirillaceae bacterium]
MQGLIVLIDLTAVAVFAASGALVASRKQMDLIGFGLMASLTGVGGGTLRDLLLGRAVFWVADAKPLAVCLVVALVLFFTAHVIQRRFQVLLWADGIGIAIYGVMGAELARLSGAGPLVAIVMGMMTATFGGLIRDVICGETPLVLRKEVYATCAVLAAAVHTGLVFAGIPLEAAALSGFAAGFALRALGIVRGLSLPVYKGRPGKEY